MELYKRKEERWNDIYAESKPVEKGIAFAKETAKLSGYQNLHFFAEDESFLDTFEPAVPDPEKSCCEKFCFTKCSQKMS